LDPDCSPVSNYSHYLVGGTVGTSAWVDNISIIQRPLNAYAKDINVWRCPSDKGQLATIYLPTLPSIFSYVWNLYAFYATSGTPTLGLNGRTEQEIRSPAETVLAGDYPIVSFNNIYGFDLRPVVHWHDRYQNLTIVVWMVTSG
jgi:hypothetical protein